MEKIIGKTIKISPRSITIKGENGKTCGVIRNTSKFQGLQANEQMKYWKILRESGIWGDTELMENVIFHDGKMYYLNNLRPLEFYEKYFASSPEDWESETRRYNKRKTVAENMGKHCIPCYIEK